VSAKIKPLGKAPQWFDKRAYPASNQLTHTQWYELLKIRQWCSHLFGTLKFQPEESETRKKKANPVLEASETNKKILDAIEFVRKAPTDVARFDKKLANVYSHISQIPRIAGSAAYQLKNLQSVQSMSVRDLSAFAASVREDRFQTAREFAENRFGFVPGVAKAAEPDWMDCHIGDDAISDRFWLAPDVQPLTVNLELRNSDLEAAFRKWLELKRRELQSQKPDGHHRNVGLLREVVIYSDLRLWAKQENLQITYPEYADYLDCAEDRVKDTIKRRAEELIFNAPFLFDAPALSSVPASAAREKPGNF